MTQPSDADRITHHCPSCGRAVSCGHELGCQRCWCDELLKLPIERLTGKRCLCPDCLQTALDKSTLQAD